MKILIYGPKARYDLYLPDYVKQLPVELVFCTSRRPTPEEVEAGDGGRKPQEKTSGGRGAWEYV